MMRSAALMFLNFTARPHYSVIFHRYLFYLFLIFFIHILFSFWRGTNPFATVKLRPTTTNDRSAPSFNQQWHRNLETNAFVNRSTSPLTVKMVVFLKIELEWRAVLTSIVQDMGKDCKHCRWMFCFVAIFIIGCGFVICRVRSNHRSVHVT